MAVEIGGSISLLLWSFIIAPVVYVVYQLVVFVVDLRHRGRAIDLFPHDPKHWLWGHLHMFPGLGDDGLAYHRGRNQHHPRSLGIWRSCMCPVLGVAHPESVKPILLTSEPKPLGFGVYRYGLPWIGDGLLLGSGAKWARNRRLLTPAFHFEILRDYIIVKNRAVEHLLDKFMVAARENKSFEIFNNISLLTFDIILRCACSYDNEIQIKGEKHPYVQAVTALGDMWTERALKPWLHFEFIYQFTSHCKTFKKHCEFVHSISDEVIQQRKKFLAGNVGDVRKDRYLDFLDILLTARDEDGKGLTDLEIRNEVDTFLFEGHDTTASAISWALYSLAEHPEHQRLCQEEIDDILSGRPDDDILSDDLPKLKYLTLCIKESMRCHCPVPFIERETTSDLTIDGITLPKGSVIDIQIYNLHHNPVVWENPMEFRPSRFLQENFEKLDNFAFVPFSAGPRNCIGQQFAMHEQKVVLARILRRFTFELDPEFKVEKKISVVMKTQKGMYMKIKERFH